MKIKQTNHKTKSGHEIVIREAKTCDAKDMIDCIKSYLKNNCIPLTPEEFNPTVEEHEKWISKFIIGKNDLLLVAEHSGKIIGNIDLTIHHRSMLNHTGYVGMGIHENWQNQGIGTMLMDKVIEWSDRHAEIEILWLQVFGTNEKGIKIYKKMGFVEDGRQKNFLKNNKGEYIDNVIMTRNKATKC
jgi:RimJ/RimL family protein N-acetyltransferase